MPLPRIYADFNALERADPSSGLACMPLTGYGTLASLARNNVRLSEGMVLLFYEPNDIECEATVHFDESRTDPAGRMGAWMALLNPDLVRDSATGEEPSNEHPCIRCGVVFDRQVGRLRNYTESCSNCGESVMAPMASPGHAV
jgi:hypothetical protein